jgi:hypothetical protein
VCLCFFASAAVGAPASPAITSAAVAILIIIMVGLSRPGYQQIERGACFARLEILNSS